MAKYSTQDRRDLAEKGHALPDGSFPIVDDEDLRSAIRNWALGKQPDVAKRFIIKRAREMNSVAVLPSKWMVNQMAHSEETDEFLAHFGVKGMKWGKHAAVKSKVNEKLDASKGGQAIGKLARYAKDHPVKAAGNVTALAAGAYITKGFVTLGAEMAYDGVRLAAAHYQNSKPFVDFTRKAIGDASKSIPYSKLIKGAYKVTTLK